MGDHSARYLGDPGSNPGVGVFFVCPALSFPLLKTRPSGSRPLWGGRCFGAMGKLPGSEAGGPGFDSRDRLFRWVGEENMDKYVVNRAKRGQNRQKTCQTWPKPSKDVPNVFRTVKYVPNVNKNDKKRAKRPQKRQKTGQTCTKPSKNVPTVHKNVEKRAKRRKICES